MKELFCTVALFALSVTSWHAAVPARAIVRVSGEAYQRCIGDRVLSRAPGATSVTLNDELALREMATGYLTAHRLIV